MKLSNLIILALLCFSCIQTYTPGYKIYSANGGKDIRTDISSLNLDKSGDPKIDEYHRINPENFLLTNFHQSQKYFHIKSSLTGKVYECTFEKGDNILIPQKDVTD